MMSEKEIKEWLEESKKYMQEDQEDYDYIELELEVEILEAILNG